MLDQGGHGDHIHIASGEDGDDVLSLAAQVPQGGYGEQAGVFHHHLMPLHNVQKGFHQLAVLNGDDPVHIFLHKGEDLIARGLDRHAVGNGGGAGEGDHMARLQAGLHGGRPGGFYADDLHMGVEQLGQGGHSRRQSPAADGYQDDLHVGQVLENLVGDGALAGGQGQVVEGVDVGQPLVLGHLSSQLGGVVKDLAVEDYLGSVVLGVVHLHQGGGGGHDDGGRHSCGLSRVGHPLGVVARRGGDQPPVLLLLGEGADLIVSAPELIGPGGLHVLRLEIDAVSAVFGQVGGVDQRRGPQDGLQYAAGRLEGFQGEHGSFSFVLISCTLYHTESQGRSQCKLSRKFSNHGAYAVYQCVSGSSL